MATVGSGCVCVCVWVCVCVGVRAESQLEAGLEFYQEVRVRSGIKEGWIKLSRLWGEGCEARKY